MRLDNLEDIDLKGHNPCSFRYQACYHEEVLFRYIGSLNMTLCPVALVAGCQKCPVFKVCPLKGVIGDYKPEEVEVETPADDKPKEVS